MLEEYQTHLARVLLKIPRLKKKLAKENKSLGIPVYTQSQGPQEIGDCEAKKPALAPHNPLARKEYTPYHTSKEASNQ